MMRILDRLTVAGAVIAVSAGVAYAQTPPNGGQPVPGSGNSTAISGANGDNNAAYNHVVGSGVKSEVGDGRPPVKRSAAVPATAAGSIIRGRRPCPVQATGRISLWARDPSAAGCPLAGCRRGTWIEWTDRRLSEPRRERHARADFPRPRGDQGSLLLSAGCGSFQFHACRDNALEPSQDIVQSGRCRAFDLHGLDADQPDSSVIRSGKPAGHCHGS